MTTLGESMNDDLISRDAVLDACSQSINILDAMSRIEDLPSAASKPCEDAISRRAAIDAVNIGNLHPGIIGALQSILADLPSVTPKQRTGHWIRKTNDYGASSYMCSECGCWHPTHNHSLGFDYCNGCGARMVEPQESEEISREEIAALLASGSENPNKCGDAISRQAVWDVMQELWGTSGELLDRLMALPSVTPKHRWIPVSERLPEENVPVLLGIRFKDDFKYFVTARIDDNYWSGIGRKLKGIGYWMPLPKPYDPQESEG